MLTDNSPHQSSDGFDYYNDLKQYDLDSENNNLAISRDARGCVLFVPFHVIYLNSYHFLLYQ